MFKKLLAGLAILGMLMVSGVATAGDKSEDIPLGHKLAYKVTNDGLRHMAYYVMDHGSLNMFAYMFGGVFISEVHFVDEGVSLKFEDYTRRGGPVAFVLDVPYDDGRSLILLEYFGDGDKLVDAVGIRSEDGILVLRYQHDGIPSIYSSVYSKYLSKLIHKYVYAEPIEHATINMGDNNAH